MPGAAVVVRPVTAADFPQKAPLWAGCNTFYERVQQRPCRHRCIRKYSG